MRLTASIKQNTRAMIYRGVSVRHALKVAKRRYARANNSIISGSHRKGIGYYMVEKTNKEQSYKS